MKNISFSDLNICKELLKGLTFMGFETPTPIQHQSIPPILEGKDIIGQAQTGTGKTAAFGIPVINNTIPSNKTTQSIIICPTRELAVQLSNELKQLSRFKKGLSILPVYGGQPIERQIKELKKGVHIVVGTPGRIQDHINRRTLNLQTVEMVVLDEADEMLDMGFRESIESILKSTPVEKQTLLFSATIPKTILELAKKYQKSPQLVKVISDQLTVKNIEQFYLKLTQKTKTEVLIRLVDIENVKLAVVFCNTKKGVDELVANLKIRGYSAEGLHGDMKQAQRNAVMSKFRRGVTKLLVATDVVARGIDVENVDTVFNFDLPQDQEYYIHRIGRTGRAGKTGKSFTFVGLREGYKIKFLEKHTRSTIKLMNIPYVEDLEKKQLDTIFSSIKENLSKNNLDKYKELIQNTFSTEHSLESVAASLMKYILDDKLKHYKTVDNSDSKSESAKSSVKGSDEGNMVKVHLNIGKEQNVKRSELLSSFSDESGIPKESFGNIKIYDNYCFVSIPKKYEKGVLYKLKTLEIHGNKVAIKKAFNKKTK